MKTTSESLSNFTGHDLHQLPSIARGEIGLHKVPLVDATAESLAGYGRIVTAFDPADVEIVPWPVSGWRPLVSGTGDEAGVVQDVFEMKRIGGIQYAENKAVGRRYVTGWFSDPATASEAESDFDTSRIYTHEANYHPDGGQIFFPRNGAAFVALLAKPGDDIGPEDFVAFYFDGTCGVHIDPGVLAPARIPHLRGRDLRRRAGASPRVRVLRFHR